jgi:membrane protein
MKLPTPGDLRRWSVTWIAVGREVWQEWRDDRASGVAAEIAFWLILTIFPVLILLGAILGSLEGIVGHDLAGRVEDQVIEWIAELLGQQSGPATDVAEDLFNGRGAGAITFTMLLVLYTASRGFAAIVRGLDVVYDTDELRSWATIRFTGLLLAVGTILVGTITLIMLVIGPVFGWGSTVAGAAGVGDWIAPAWNTVGPILAFVVLIMWAATIYHIGPHHVSPWKWDLPGAFLVAVFAIVASVGFRIYVDVATGANAVYGVVGGAITTMLYVYVLSAGLLLGAELNAVLATRYGVQAEPARSRGIVERVRQRYESPEH